MATTKAVEKVLAVKRNFARQLQEIREDRNLTQDGKDRKLAKLNRDVQDEVRKLRAEHEAERQAEIQDAQRKAFGAPTRYVNTQEANLAIEARYFAALDGAAGLTAAQLRSALERSMRMGDDVRARALAVAIVEQEMGSPLPVKTSAAQAYFDANPEFVDKVNAVIVASAGPAALAGADGNAALGGTGSVRATARMTENAAFHLSPPDELARYGGGELDMLANDADAMSGADT